MRRTWLLSSLLFCALWLVAQTNPNQTLAPDRGTKTGNDQITLQGCLSESNGDYTLTDASGNVYRLVGTSSTVKEQVGHTVEVTGINSSHVPRSTGSASEPAAPPTLTVTAVKDVADSCSSNR